MQRLFSSAGFAMVVSLWTCGLVTPMFAQGSVVGSWDGPWDWSLIDYSIPPPGGDRELGHAALLLTGAKPGVVLLWLYDFNPNGTRTFIFDPATPGMAQEVAMSGTNIFCSAHTFRADGTLIATGGLPFPGGCCFASGTPTCSTDETWLFDPGSWTWIPFGQNSAAQPGKMNRSRYYGGQVAIISRPGMLAGDPLVFAGTMDNGCGSHSPAPTPFTDVRDGGYVSGFEYPVVTPQPPPAPPSNVWTEVGHTEGTTFPPGYINPPTYWPNFPANPNTYFRYYPHSYLLAKPTPTSPETVLIAGDTHAELFWPDPGDAPVNTFPTSANPDNTRQMKNWLRRSPTDPSSVTYALDVSQPTPVLAATPPLPAPPTSYVNLQRRFYGSSVLMHTLTGGSYVLNRVLTFGGSDGPSNQTILPTVVQEWDATAQQWVNKAPLLYQRIFQNAVVLPNGQIFVVGGTGADDQNVYPGTAIAQLPVPQAELYTPGPGPASGSGSSFAVPPPGRARGYHSLAILLTDGRVLVCGGADLAVAHSADSGEIYSPPYCFTRRPLLSSSSHSTTYPPSTADDVTLVVQKIFNANPATDSKVVLMRPGSVTHHRDFEQRYIELPITAAHFDSAPRLWTVRAARPFDKTLAPPGWYMLFFVENGIPSVSRSILLL